jgi:hypothetical protein
MIERVELIVFQFDNGRSSSRRAMLLRAPGFDKSSLHRPKAGQFCGRYGYSCELSYDARWGCDLLRSGHGGLVADGRQETRETGASRSASLIPRRTRIRVFSKSVGGYLLAAVVSGSRSSISLQ